MSHAASMMLVLVRFTIPRSLVGAAILVAISYAYPLRLLSVIEPDVAFAIIQRVSGRLLIWTMYAPSLVMLMLRAAEPQGRGHDAVTCAKE